jgi:uncharacterized coiled-coil protein SlyX
VDEENRTRRLDPRETSRLERPDRGWSAADHPDDRYASAEEEPVEQEWSTPAPEGPRGRQWSTPAVVLWSVVGLLVGAILALLLLPDEAATVPAGDPAAEALAEAQAALGQREALLAERDRTIGELNAGIAERDAAIADLDARIADRDARIAELTEQLARAAEAPDQPADTAAEQALAERSAALDARETALVERAAVLDAREAAVAAREAAADDGGVPPLDLPSELPDVDLPTVEEGRGVLERLRDRLLDIFGGQ